MSDVAQRLADVLAEGRRRGLLGPGPVEAHIAHARSFAAAIGESDPEAGLDLGTGGGVPGLVLAGVFPQTRWVLLDSRERSINFVTDAIRELGLEDRVTAILGRAEELGRAGEHRGRYGVVVARGFGPPAVTAECGAPLLRVGGRLIVAEPPGGAPDRWPAAPLASVGLRLLADQGSDLHQQASLAVLELTSPVPSTYPRRVGVPAKRPLFSVSRETKTGT